MTAVREHALKDPEGVRWIPDEHDGTGVLVVAGSSGRIDAQRARLFADAGCIAESIRWFGGPEQHDGPWEIPLETFLSRIDDLAEECDRIVVVGTSFGSEAALLCGAHSASVNAVVAFAPSDVVWAGYDHDRVTSHWTFEGLPLPYVPFDWDGFIEEAPARFCPLYERSYATFADQIPAATIPVEKIAELVLVAGGDDQVWPSVEQARRILDRRDRAGLETVVVVDEESGHRTVLPGEQVVSGGMTMQRGGDETADRRLGEHAWQAITELLRRLPNS